MEEEEIGEGDTLTCCQFGFIIQNSICSVKLCSDRHTGVRRYPVSEITLINRVPADGSISRTAFATLHLRDAPSLPVLALRILPRRFA
jgi:hypothetical protein